MSSRLTKPPAHKKAASCKPLPAWWWRFFARVFRFLIISILLSGVLVGGLVVYFSQNLPDVRDIYTTFRRPSITLFDQNGILIATYGDTYGEMVAVESLPANVVNALLSVEDRRFYEHFGIDVAVGIFRALWVNYRAGVVVQGGSTLTQQLAKNILQANRLYGPNDRSFKRKIQEAILAIMLESKLTKKQILTLYLNRVYFGGGGGAFGVDAAAMRYFGQHARQINLYEAAVLMGLLKAPSRYSPAQNPERSNERACQVLRKMVEAGFISRDTMEMAILMATPPPEFSNASSVRYFTDWVVDNLSQYVSLDQDLEVDTTLDLSLQNLAEEKAAEVMKAQGKEWGAEQLALVTMTPDGSVKAMLGGIDYRATKFNRATQALRQPGSVFKFFTFLAALESGMTPETFVEDTPPVIGQWKPKNYRYTPQGEISLKTAFAKSVNAVAVRLAMRLGVQRILKMARKLGITTKIPPNLSIALGTGEVTLLELTGAFATVANQGMRSIPHGVSQIRSKQGHVLFRWEPSQEKILEPSVIDKVRVLMRAVIEQGTGRSASIGRPAIGKTGTSQEYRDTWFVGATPELVTGVWSGRDSDKPMTRVVGGSPSVHLWKTFMQPSLAETPIHDFRTPVWPENTSPTSQTSPDTPLGSLLAEPAKDQDSPEQREEPQLFSSEMTLSEKDPRQVFGGWEGTSLDNSVRKPHEVSSNERNQEGEETLQESFSSIDELLE